MTQFNLRRSVDWLLGVIGSMHLTPFSSRVPRFLHYHLCRGHPLSHNLLLPQFREAEEASGITRPLVLRMDADSKDHLLPSADSPSSSNSSSQMLAGAGKKLPATDLIYKSGLSSLFKSAPINNDGQPNSRPQVENDGQPNSRPPVESDDAGSSSSSILSASTTYQSSRGPATSHSSGNFHLDGDLSGSLNDSCRQAASHPPTSEGKEDPPANGGVTFKSDGLERERPSSESVPIRPRQSLPVEIRTNGSLVSSASQLLSEWNDSPFVSSYPNQNQHAMETCAGEWSSVGLPWHIELQNVVTGDMVATGSYGMVFKGIYQEKKVAVKVLLIPEASSKRELRRLQANFREEIDIWYKLSHVNVVQFIGAYIGHPKWAIITEFLDGGSLRAYLLRQQRRRLTTATIFSMAMDIARGMEYLHKNHIMHRDLKTANLLLDENGTVKVADFGLARFEAEDPGNLTAETGTIRWMAPEVICHLPYSRKIDVYSYGIVLWELCTSLVPYEGMSFVQLAHAVANDHHRPSTSDLPGFFVKLMRQCWDKDKTKRPEFSAIITYLEHGFADSSKILSKSGYKATRSEKGPPADSYSRPTKSMHGGQVLGRSQATGPAYVADKEDTLTDDEDPDEEWLSIRRQCRCTIM